MPVVALNKIFRQAAKSKIIVNAHNVNNGESFLNKKEDTEERLDDFFYINESAQDKMLYQVISLCKERLKKYGNYDFFQDMQVLTPTKKGMLGTKELNKALQEALNPEADLKKEKPYGEQIFREGDRVMQIKNDYDIYWSKEEENRNRHFQWRNRKSRQNRRRRKTNENNLRRRKRGMVHIFTTRRARTCLRNNNTQSTRQRI